MSAQTELHKMATGLEMSAAEYVALREQLSSGQYRVRNEAAEYEALREQY